MPSWNIHTAHVERLLSERPLAALGLTSANAFLFGNYTPDVYVGYMVPDASFRVDYRITHVTPGNLIPTPHADAFWDDYVVRWKGSAKPAPEGQELDLTLGAWAHLVTDRYYNGRFRTFWQTHEMPTGEQLRRRKQADFDLFGRSLGISRAVAVTPELVRAAHDFGPYRIAEADVRRAVQVASTIVRENAVVPAQCDHYQLLSAEWMAGVFEACNERLVAWLEAFACLRREGRDFHAASVRAQAGLPPETTDDPRWMQAGKAASRAH